MNVSLSTAKVSVSALIIFFIGHSLHAFNGYSFDSYVKLVEGKVTTKDKKGLNVRSCSSKKCEIIGGLKDNKIYYFEHYSPKDWLKLFNVDGYVHKDFIKIVTGRLDNNYSYSNKVSDENKIESSIFSLIKSKIGLKIDKNKVKNLNLRFLRNDLIEYTFLYNKKMHKGLLINNNEIRLEFNDNVYCNGSIQLNRKKRTLVSYNKKIKMTPKPFFSPLDEKAGPIGFSYDRILQNGCFFDFKFNALNSPLNKKPLYYDSRKKSKSPTNIDISSYKVPTLINDVHLKKLRKYGNGNYVGFYENNSKRSIDFKTKLKTHSTVDKEDNFVYKITGKKFSVLFHQNKKKNSFEMKGIAAYSDIRVNDLIIKKGEYIDIYDISLFYSLNKKFPRLKKNIDYRFSRSIEDYNKGNKKYYINFKDYWTSPLAKYNPKYLLDAGDQNNYTGFIVRAPRLNLNTNEIYPYKLGYIRGGFAHIKLQEPYDYYRSDDGLSLDEKIDVFLKNLEKYNLEKKDIKDFFLEEEPVI